MKEKQLTVASIPPAFALHNVTLALPSESGTVEILKGVTLEAETGKSIAITGPSGSGKTSLLMVAAGLERPTTGTVTIDGLALDHDNEKAVSRLRGEKIGIIFQGFHLMPTMTALENVALPLELAGIENPWGAAKETLSLVGLGHRLDHYPHQLSGGEQQRVAIARAFVIRPKILFADEPTGNLDQETGRQVMNLLFSLQAEHRTTLALITHDARLAARCECTIVMADGKIAA